MFILPKPACSASRGYADISAVTEAAPMRPWAHGSFLARSPANRPVRVMAGRSRMPAYCPALLPF